MGNPHHHGIYQFFLGRREFKEVIVRSAKKRARIFSILKKFVKKKFVFPKLVRGREIFFFFSI
jgi:hypothetical protein